MSKGSAMWICEWGKKTTMWVRLDGRSWPYKLTSVLAGVGRKNRWFFTWDSAWENYVSTSDGVDALVADIQAELDHA